MPLLPVPIELPPNFVEAAAGDVDGDGRAELVLVSRIEKGAQIDGIELTIIGLSEAGRVEDRRTVSLGNRAMLWDPNGGIWTMDAKGIKELHSGDRVVARGTMLGGLGPTTPQRTTLVHDLDGDGRVELMLWDKETLRVYRVDGAPFGAISAPMQGDLSSRTRAGGQVWAATRTTPAIHVADADGDGLQDVLMIQGRELVVAFTGETAGVRQERWPLPFDLETDEQAGDETRRDVTDVELSDITGDGCVDVMANELVTEGSFFGAEAEIHFSAGTCGGFGSVQTLETGTGSTTLELVDVDADGDRDLVLSQIDVGFGNLTKALVSRSLEVELVRYALNDDRFSTSAVPLGSLDVSLEEFQLAWSIYGDLNGDGRPDLVRHDQGVIYVHDGDSEALLGDHRAGSKVDELLVWDLTGDGRAELLAWAPGEARAVLIRVVDP